MGLGDNTRHRYRIRACNAGSCSAWSNDVTVTTPVAVPEAPSELQGSALSGSWIRLSWSDNSDNKTHFQLQRRRRNP